MILYENNFLIESDDDPSYDSDILVNNGIFYGQDSEGKVYKLPDSMQKELKVKYYHWKRMQKDKEDGFDVEEIKKEYKNSLEGSADTSRIEADIDKEQKKNYEKYRKLKQDEKASKEEMRQNREKAKEMKNAMSGSSAFSILSPKLKTFVNNQLQDTPKYEFRRSYATPDRYNPSPDIIMPGRGRSRMDPKKGNKDKQVPLVLFYFDRSASFVGAPEKTELGKLLLNMFEAEQLAGKLEVDVTYFSTSYHSQSAESNAEEAAIKEYHHTRAAFLQDIKDRTEGRIANIIILTDADIDNADGRVNPYPNVTINGSVWIIFAGSQGTGELKRKFKKANAQTTIDVTYFPSLTY